METFLIVIAIILGLVGIVGCILPVIPGPPISWVGLLILYLWGGGADSAGEPMSLRFIIIWLIITIVVTIMDYIIPSWFTKKFGGSRYASRGALLGLLIGLFFTPVGIIIGTMAGAFLAELVFERKDASDSLRSAFGAFMGFISGTGLKLFVCGIMLYYIFVYIR